MKNKILILGIGNILMGDEGVGVHVLRHIIDHYELPEGVEGLDGGTGSLVLLEPMQQAETVILLDATEDGSPAGTMHRLEPKFSKDYPKTLTAHDIGLKDLLDAFYLLGDVPKVVLYAISIVDFDQLSINLSDETAIKVPALAEQIFSELPLDILSKRIKDD